MDKLAVQHSVGTPTIWRWLKEAGVESRRRGYISREGVRIGIQPKVCMMGGYLMARGRDKKYHYIHRACWEAHYPLREGFHVHHINGDTLNNEMWNLAALAPGIHRQVHAEETRRALEAYRAQ